MWQDICILILNGVFGLMLLPQIKELYKKGTSLNLVSCVMTLSALIILGITYTTLGLVLAVCGNLIDVGAWAVLLVLSVRNRR
jgi:hypothetical protein